MDKRLLSNNNVEVRIGLESSVLDITAATKAELDALLSIRAVLRWDQFDLNVQASTTDEDPTVDEEAGTQIRSLLQFGGAMSLLTPKPGDTGLASRARDLLMVPHNRLVVAIRVGQPKALASASGQVWNLYKVITDAQRHARNDTGYSYSVNLRPLGLAGINAIVPAVPATAVVVTVPGSLSVGEPAPLNAMYQGRDITVGAEYVVSDESKAIVTTGGWVIPLAAGTATVAATYPGSAAGTAATLTITV